MLYTLIILGKALRCGKISPADEYQKRNKKRIKL